jgi:hypothetical protein
MSYKHTISLNIILTLETSEKLDPDELEVVVQELNYNFESDYGWSATIIDDFEILSHNRKIV